jgi:hypothetical protein
MTRYSTDHIPGDDGRNALARKMNRVVDFAEKWGNDSERTEVAALLSYLAEWREIEEAETEPEPVCRNPEHEDRL